MRKIGLTLLVGLLLVMGLVGVVYSAVDVVGYVVFKDGTSMEQALVVMEKYDVTLVQYTTPQNRAGIGSGAFFDGVFDHNSLKNDFWRDYAEILESQQRRVKRIDANPVASTYANWPTQKQGILNEIARFEANEDGCWEDDTCPTFLVAEFEVQAPVSVLQAMEGESVIEEVGWPAKFGLMSQTDENPPHWEWVPNFFIVEGNQDTVESRFLDVDFGWTDAEDLAYFQTGSTVYRSGINLTLENGTYYTTTKSFTGHPKLFKRWSYSDVPRPYLALRGAFGGSGRVDYSYGSLQAEAFESQTTYGVSFVYANGTAELDNGDIASQAGTRSCRFLFCVSWQGPGLILEEAQIALPGKSEYELAARVVHLPVILSQVVQEAVWQAR